MHGRFSSLVRCVVVMLASGCSGASADMIGVPADCADEAPAIGHSGTSGACDVALPSAESCMQGVPRYAEIAAIVAQRCTVCHQPTGSERVHQFDTYALAYQQRKDMLVQVYACRMPPACGPSLAPEDRAQLMKWLVCGAPADTEPPAGAL